MPSTSAARILGLLDAAVLAGESSAPCSPLDVLRVERAQQEGWLHEKQVISYYDDDGWLVVERFDGVKRDAQGRPTIMLTPLPIRELAYYRRQIKLARDMGRDPAPEWEERVAWLRGRV